MAASRLAAAAPPRFCLIPANPPSWIWTKVFFFFFFTPPSKRGVFPGVGEAKVLIRAEGGGGADRRLAFSSHGAAD